MLVDIVPNHVGVATPHLSVWWWDVLTNGPASVHAHAFDIDWEAGGGKLRLPILGDEDEPELRIDDGELRYYDHRFPLAPGSADDGASATEVHRRQHYELMSWRRADQDLNYRRFFAINTLAGIRVELPEVFEASHREIVSWVDEGLVDGLRVDHPDGLADPERTSIVADATGGVPVRVEKILEGDEPLPAHWRVVGTTGYDALATIDRLFVDPSAREVLGGRRGADLIHDTKRAVADGMLNSEVRRLVRAPSMSADPHAVDAVAELLACFPVYRSYLPLDMSHLDDAAADAVRRRAELTATIDAVVTLLADRGATRGRPLPADLGDGDGQGGRGLRVLPVHPARNAHRGRRRSG